MSLVGLAEIAELLGVTKQVIANWRSRKPDFPQPVVTLKSGPVWEFESIESWAAKEGLVVAGAASEETSPEDRKSRSAMVVAMMNMKGGVGKSTLTANLGWYAAVRKDLRVLLVDLDPQFNLSQYILGVDGYEKLLAAKHPTIEALFRKPSADHSTPEFAELIHEVRNWDDGSCLHLVPAELELAWSMRLALERAHLLRDGIDDVKSRYDLVLIDCAPTESILSWSAYFAADFIFVPVKPEFLSTIGLPLLLRSVNEFALSHRTEKEPIIGGIIFNDTGEKIEHDRSRDFVRQVASDHDLYVFENEVSHSESYPAGARIGKPIFWTGNARTWKKAEFSRVAREFLERIGL